MEISFISAALYAGFIFISLLYFLLYERRPKNFPPGPIGIPLFGNALQMGLESYKVASKMGDKYGDVIGLKLGERWAVVLNDLDDIRNAFNRQDFTGRLMYDSIYDATCGETTTKGVILSIGRRWMEQRRFCVKALRDFGSGTKSIEPIIMQEVNDVIETFKKKTGQSIKTSHSFLIAIINIVWAVVAGERFSHDDPQIQQLLEVQYAQPHATERMTPFLFLFPTLYRIRETLPFLFPDEKKFKNTIYAWLGKTIQQHRKTMQEGSPRDLIDAYLEEMAKTNDPDSTFYPSGSDDLELTRLLSDLFVAGGESPANVLVWSFFLLALHPNVQEKFFKEIQTAVGDRQVSLNDKPSLPYAEATILEIMRVSTLTPLVVPHTAIEDTTFKNYFIPKDTLIIGNSYACHFRASIWGDPHNFRPERFLSADEKTVIKSKYLITFGTGKRACFGEGLARDEVFLFLTNLVQTFSIGMPKDEPKHTLRLVAGHTSQTEPHNIVLKERN